MNAQKVSVQHFSVKGVLLPVCYLVAFIAAKDVHVGF